MIKEEEEVLDLLADCFNLPREYFEKRMDIEDWQLLVEYYHYHPVSVVKIEDLGEYEGIGRVAGLAWVCTKEGFRGNKRAFFLCMDAMYRIKDRGFAGVCLFTTYPYYYKKMGFKETERENFMVFMFNNIPCHSLMDVEEF